ncbi:otoferlin [Diorhabda carinulata]|uniref:otoferlin n=1 Tax=Diorhabda carinulata TaxID=1163345 RepID=UPI0025A255D7|nr:otoferlin [Diorhabda carinulata]
MSNKIFLITIAILEGRHYIWENMDSVVLINIDKYRKATNVKKNSSSPYYNEYFVFEFYTTLDILLHKNIKIMVIQPRNLWRKRKLLGEIKLDVATVWQQKHHQFYHKWAILNSAKAEVYSGPRGYLKVDICVLTKGEIPKTPINIVNDNIEGNLLLSEGRYVERQRATYIFDVYSCRNIIEKPSITFENDLSQQSTKNKQSMYIEITFAGVSVRTSTKKIASSIEFNERLFIIDLFPPLSQTIKIEACYTDTFRKNVHSQKQIGLQQISNDKHEGFLPTLGPTFLHLYPDNIMEGFAGTILMAIDTKLDESDERKENKIENIPPLNEKFRNLHKILNRISSLVEDVQDCWPDIILWFVCGKKKVSCIKIPARDVIYSPNPEEKGEYCGVKRTICFYENRLDDNRLTAKMDFTMFLCLEKQKIPCLSEISSIGRYLLEKVDSIPTHLVETDKKLFQLRCYLFQGEIICGFDHSGLSDPFVRIIFQNMLQETEVIENSLDPVWDQTLVFNEIYMNESDVPSILFEILDKDDFGKIEFIGRTIINPQIKCPENNLKLKWYQTYRNDEVTGEVLAAFEYVTESDLSDLPKEGKIFSIPKALKPTLVSHKLDVLFWGIRKPGKINFIPIRRPRITALCGDFSLNSDVLENVSEDPNFSHQSKSISLTIPTETEYAPPFRFEMYDSKKFGVYTFAGVHITKCSSFIVTPITRKQRLEKLAGHVEIYNSSDSGSDSLLFLQQNLEEIKSPIRPSETKKKKLRSCLLSRCCKYFWNRDNKSKSVFWNQSSGSYEPLNQEDDEDVEDYDWWTKFYASIKVYNSELESQTEFNGFTDILASFPIFKGKRTGDEVIDQEKITGIFKGSIKIYRYPIIGDDDYVFPNGVSIEQGYFSHYPENHPVRYLLRVYCIRALNLRPKDLNGKSDPYIILSLNKQEINDKEHYIAKNVNPVFGQCYEFKAVFPQDYLLKISVWDYDLTTADDLIGETEIDLENRFYTKHMAFCGIAETYEEFGYCTWRDQHKPTCILSEICHKWNAGTPEYKETSVQIGDKEFLIENFNPSGDFDYDKEVLALFVLRRWKEMPLIGFPLVPEHVETRSLFHPSKPGIEQGKLQLWIDIFPILDIPPPGKVDITLRKPLTYELRVIIWNTEEVLLDEDDFFTGEKKSDIYVKGWVGDNLQIQYTDVHYRSLTGEGNFNWRFIFNFDYIPAENKIVIRKKENIFAIDQTEFKMPCRLTLQVWDNDTFSKDDFLGTLSLELAKLYRPAKTANKCTLKIVERGAPTINLFKIRRTKGWWPFKAGYSKNETCTGKVEAEFELISLEEASKEPAGKGRHEPQSLPTPNRPDTSFTWFKNPLRTFKYVIFKLHKWKLIKWLIFLLLVFMIVAAMYSFPGYTVKKILGV